MSHTPGPWATEADRIVSQYGDIATLHYQSARHAKGWTAGADARLIAAAPELLEALKVTLGYADAEMHHETVNEYARLIDRAEGRADEP